MISHHRVIGNKKCNIQLLTYAEMNESMELQEYASHVSRSQLLTILMTTTNQ